MTQGEAAVGLDLFAAAWVERWTLHGGSITVDTSGNDHMFARVNSSDIPGYELPATLTDEERYRRRQVDDLMLSGRTRELLELLEFVPGGREAVKAHVRCFPSIAYQGGTLAIA